MTSRKTAADPAQGAGARRALSRAYDEPFLPRADAMTPYERIGGAAPVAQIVRRFYELMDTDPAYARLRAMHARDLTPMVESLTGFLTAWMGGPRDWFATRPGACMMSLHAAIPGIDRDTADQWIAAMTRAAAEAIPEDVDLRTSVLEALWRMAHGMAARAAAA